MSVARKRLWEILRERSFQFGDFTLVSGKKSNFYLDVKKTMFDSEGLFLLTNFIFRKLIVSGMPDMIGGLEMGAVPLIAAVCYHAQMTGYSLPGFFVRKAAKEHGTKQRIEGQSSLRDKRVVILEDVTTTGGSALVAAQAVREAGGIVVAILTVIDREDPDSLLPASGIPYYSIFRAAEFMPNGTPSDT